MIVYVGNNDNAVSLEVSDEAPEASIVMDVIGAWSGAYPDEAMSWVAAEDDDAGKGLAKALSVRSKTSDAAAKLVPEAVEEVE